MELIKQQELINSFARIGVTVRIATRNFVLFGFSLRIANEKFLADYWSGKPRTRIRRKKYNACMCELKRIRKERHKFLS